MPAAVGTEFLEALLREAGALLRDRFAAGVAVGMKGLRDPVTEADTAAERLIVDRIEARFPGHSIVTEEARSAERGTARWTIDPLDGTNNFARGVPHFCVSIAFAEAGAVNLGGIYDPLRDELFLAERGAGATLNGRPLRVTAAGTLIASLLATGFAYCRNEVADDNRAPFHRLINEIQDIRRLGSAALDLAWVAAGRFDGFWEYHLKPWDTAAGALLVTEAGGTVTDGDGRPFVPGGRLVVATGGRIHAALLEKLKD